MSRPTKLSKRLLRLCMLAPLPLMTAVISPCRAELPEPVPDAPGRTHIWYGASPDNGQQAPVLVFVPGMGQKASFFWTNGNDMYAEAYAAGYRTAFISFAREDGAPNNLAIEHNGNLLKLLLPEIAARYGVGKLYLVGHSKGGLDIQAALSDPAIQALTRAVFTLGTPNSGTELADWAFGSGQLIAEQLGLLSPAVSDMQTGMMSVFRQKIDPILERARIPFYTVSGTTYSGHHSLLQLTGYILSRLLDGAPNDGLVPVTRSKLPGSYAAELGQLSLNHFEVGQGEIAFPIIHKQIRGLESLSALEVRISRRPVLDPQLGRLHPPLPRPGFEQE